LRAVAKRPGVYRVSAFFARQLARVYFRLGTRGSKNIPALGPVILASNHVSFLDPPLIGAFLPRKIHFLARKTLFDSPLLGWLIRQLQAVPVDRDGGGGLETVSTWRPYNRVGEILHAPGIALRAPRWGWARRSSSC
jgi:1-acyl-sn-glycerol-3-phosphate acyltransferase